MGYLGPSYLGYIHKLHWQDLGFFDHLPPSVDIFYLIKVDKKSTFLDYLPPSSCNRSLWTIHLAGSNKNRHSFKNLAEDGTLNGKGANLCNSVPNIENGRMICKNYGNGGKKCSPICNDGHQFYQKVAEQFIPPRLFNPKQQPRTFQTSSLLSWTFQPQKS